MVYVITAAEKMTRDVHRQGGPVRSAVRSSSLWETLTAADAVFVKHTDDNTMMLFVSRLLNVCLDGLFCYTINFSFKLLQIKKYESSGYVRPPPGLTLNV